MGLLEDWCDKEGTKDDRKRYLTFVEKEDGREAIRDTLAETMRSHYDRLDRIADDVARLGYDGAAEILRTVLPTSAKARSGELGEIIATELVEEEIGFRVPVRRLRYKDGREMALRGDDFIGVGYDPDEKLWLLKGEAKSNKVLGKTTITKAREALCRHDGRCTPDSLLFVANRLLESDDENDVELGRTIRDGIGTKAIRKSRVDHMLFTMSGNVPPAALKADLDAASNDRNHHVVNLHIEDHQEFIAQMYKEVQKLGDA
ncbi:Hachiman antiphage defense system protein HamA [Sphingomonas sp. PL20]|uniref:Hachiman antiphage defense system protein HamA n=1 Tax=Sphingomonas sp. PL20 TaxID=2760712 RepID=UPI001AEAB328